MTRHNWNIQVSITCNSGYIQLTSDQIIFRNAVSKKLVQETNLNFQERNIHYTGTSSESKHIEIQSTSIEHTYTEIKSPDTLKFRALVQC